MSLEDFVESEVAVAVAATAAVLSPRVRRLAHSGAVYGLAGALIAADAVTATARGVGRGVQEGGGGVGHGLRQAASSAGGVAQEAAGTAGGVARSAAERVRGIRPTESGS
jgi:hypothetical protein